MEAVIAGGLISLIIICIAYILYLDRNGDL